MAHAAPGSNRIRLITPMLALVAALAFVACGGASAGLSTSPEPTPEPAPEPEPVAEAPVADADGDGIPDDEDMCPERAGVANLENPSRHGCPERRGNRVRIERNRVEITEKIMFGTNTAAIDPASHSLLDEIAETINEAGRRITLIEIAGHADKRGKVQHNLSLTEQRATAVVAALVERGVPAEKLRAKGYGSYCPVDAANDDANRRVEFVILKMRRRATGATVGCEAATAAGVAPDPVE
jgi:OmpA-OmpF porin, OOP family